MIQCTVTTSGTGFTVDISPTDNCTVANGVVTATDETAQANFSVEFLAAVGYKITNIEWTGSSDVNVLQDGNSFAVSFNGSDPGSEASNTLAFTVTTTEGNIEINITSNGTTTLATAGKLCNRNIDVVTNVPSSGEDGVYFPQPQIQYFRAGTMLDEQISLSFSSVAIATNLDMGTIHTYNK